MNHQHSEESIRLSNVISEYLKMSYQEIKNSVDFGILTPSRAVMKDIKFAYANKATKYVYVCVVDHPEFVKFYVGSKTAEDETLSFFESEYTGTQKKKKHEFDTDCSKYDFFILCIQIGEDSGELLNLEHDILIQHDCGNPTNTRFYNESNRVGGASKSLDTSDKKKTHIINRLEKTFSSEESDDCYPIVEESVEYLFSLSRLQARLIANAEGIIPEKLKTMKASAKADGGKELLKNFRGVLVLKDYLGKGKHVRIGSTHTIPTIKKYTPIQKLKTIYIDDHDRLLTDNDIACLILFDNAEQEKLFDPTSPEERLNHCMSKIEQLKTDHLDPRIKYDYLKLGGTDATWKAGDRQRLKDFYRKLDSAQLDPVPAGHEIIDWAKQHEKRNWALENNKDQIHKRNSIVVSSAKSGGSLPHLNEFVTWLEGYLNSIESDSEQKFQFGIPYYPILRIGTYHTTPKHREFWENGRDEEEEERINLIKNVFNKSLPKKYQFDVDFVPLKNHREKKNNGVYSDI